MREASAAGPFTDWPLQRGFDRFYGFMQGETDQFHPELYADNHMIPQPSRPEDGYHLSEDLVDQSIAMIEIGVARARAALLSLSSFWRDPRPTSSAG